MSTNNIVYEGPITIVLLDNGERLYGPTSLPDDLFHRRWDQLTICGAHERHSDEIVTFEHSRGILETSDKFRPPSMCRWNLVSISLLEIPAQ